MPDVPHPDVLDVLVDSAYHVASRAVDPLEQGLESARRREEREQLVEHVARIAHGGRRAAEQGILSHALFDLRLRESQDVRERGSKELPGRSIDRPRPLGRLGHVLLDVPIEPIAPPSRAAVRGASSTRRTWCSCATSRAREVVTTEEPRASEPETGDLRALALDRRGRERVRALLNPLTESTFFYREDDPDLFFFLRRNQAAVRELFQTYFGWRLYVDRQCARVIKERQYNEALRPSQRALFDLRRRDECLLFVLLLEFHEDEGQRQGVTPDDDRHLRFLLGDFVTFAMRPFREELGEATPPDARILEAARPLFEQLERHRFVRLVDNKQAEAGEDLPAGLSEHLLYEFLPGIRCYDPSIAARSVVLRAYRTAPGDEAEEAAASASPGPSVESEP